MNHDHDGENKNLTEFYYTCPMHPETKQDNPGICPECGMNLVPVKSKKIAEDKQAYTCPMHPEIKSDKPGICPECGMNLVKIKPKKMTAENFNKHAGHSTQMFLKKF